MLPGEQNESPKTFVKTIYSVFRKQFQLVSPGNCQDFLEFTALR